MSLTLDDIKHPKIKAWVEECIKMCEPDNVVVVDGSDEEYDRLMQLCVDKGLATPLKKKEHSFLFRSLPSDVARVESRTFISSVKNICSLKNFFLCSFNFCCSSGGANSSALILINCS